jgi:hypothetical protein
MLWRRTPPQRPLTEFWTRRTFKHMNTHSGVEFARCLLRHYGAEALGEELEAWEFVRSNAHVPRYAEPEDLNAQTLIALDGIPGAGKSTTQRWLQPAVGAAYFSMARFAEARGVSADARRQHQLATGRPHPVDEAFIEVLAACDARFILLEKFPRSVIEATALLASVRALGRRFEVLHLQLPGDCVALSTRRQIERGPRHGKLPEPKFAEHRALVHLARATSGRETLRASGVPIHALDMTRPEASNVEHLRRGLGLHPEALGWPRERLEILERVGKRLGIEEAWVASGGVYRAFWNDRFGPAQQPTDTDVAVDDDRAVAPLLRALESEAPEIRWSVLAPSTRLRERFGIETHSAAEAKSYGALRHRLGLVRSREGRIEWQLPEGTEACLRNGILALNPKLLAAISESDRRQLLGREPHHLLRALSDYPGLRVEPQTEELLAGSPAWRSHRPQRIATRWPRLKQLGLDAQRERVWDARAFCRRALGSEEKALALEILRFHQTAERRATPPPLPPKPFRASRTGPRLEELAREADDAEFGDWFLDQVHHHQPRGGADPYLRSVLDFTLFKRTLRTLHREQSVMHQGWTLERHLAQSVLQLQTDGLLGQLSNRHDSGWCRDLRLSMRIAMLFHDTGKLLGSRPRRHAIISAALFGRFKPDWFPESLVPLTQWCIRTHDVFGAFSRGLTDKEGVAPGEYREDLSLETSYFAALDSQALRAVLVESGLPLEEAVAINKALWCADIGSIATLRWLLPVAALVERLVLAPGAERTAANRRSDEAAAAQA